VDLEEVKVVPESAYESEWPTLHQAVHARRATVAHVGARGRPGVSLVKVEPTRSGTSPVVLELASRKAVSFTPQPAGPSSRPSPGRGAAGILAADPALVAAPLHKEEPKVQPSSGVGGKAPAQPPLVGLGAPLYKEGDLLVDLYKLAVARAAKPRVITSEGNAAAKATKAISMLLPLICAELVRKGVGVTQFFDPFDPCARYEHLFEAVLRGPAGKNGTKADKARLFIEDFMAHGGALGAAQGPRGAPPSIFPVSVDDVRAVIKVLRDAALPTAVSRITDALDLLRDIGCEVPPKDSAFGFSAASVPVGQSTKRACPPPMWVLLDEGWAGAATREVDGSAVNPHSDFVSHSVLRRRLGDRGGNYGESRFLSMAECEACNIKGFDTSKYAALVCQENKARKRDSVQFFPLESLIDPGTCPWAGAFVAFYSRIGFMFRDFALNKAYVPAPKGQLCITKPCVWVLDSEQPSGYRMCAPEKAAVASNAARSMTTGLSLDEMQEAKWSGNHADRHISAEATSRARWPEKEASVMGDWAVSKEGAPKGRTAGGRSARQAYHPNFSLKEQINARLRYVRMMQAAFGLYQKDGRRVTWKTTWSDLIPDVAPPELAEFYGPRSVDYCPEIDTSAAFVGVTYEPPKALKAAAKRARPMGLQLSASSRARR
jgi:hypothetical protein